ncbi:MAG: cobamide remodeling phosphodiesterase CbiR [Pseudomonadota bacterium]
MEDPRFKLGTTSFIVPDHIIPNVIKLGPFFDEIELLVFESRPREVLPSKRQIDELVALSIEYGLTYNVHLPVDVSLSFGSINAQKKAEQTLLEVLSLLKPLKATTHTLHLAMPSHIKAKACKGQSINNWKNTLGHTLDDFLSQVDDPKKISIETLDYPFSMIEDVIQERSLPICIDIGHGMKHGYNWMEIFEKDGARIPLVHLHGVDFLSHPFKDHQGLDKLPDEQLSQVISFLKAYSGVVSLEVFNIENLTLSLNLLARHFKNIPAIGS